MILRVGILGVSEGNGHPYSWSAICNGYSKTEILNCNYPEIIHYLSKEKWPESKIKGVRITHIWTQNIQVSYQIAKATFIQNVVQYPCEMIGSIDAVLLARDDAENHYELAKQFIEFGLPIYIDKPIALNMKDLYKLMEIQKYSGQIFSCSALLFSENLKLSQKQNIEIGELKTINAVSPKRWKTYSIHLIETVLNIVNSPFDPVKCCSYRNRLGGEILYLRFPEGPEVIFNCLGKNVKSKIKFDIFGNNGSCCLEFSDTFFSFKSALNHFFDMVRNEKFVNYQGRYEKCVKIIEMI